LNRLKAVSTISLFFLITSCLTAEAVKFKGRVQGSYFQQDDDTQNHRYTFTTARLKFKATEFTEKKNKIVNFEARTRQAGSKDYGNDVPETRIEDANLELLRLLYNTDVILGRQFVRDSYGARVDGLTFRHYFAENSGIGIFGGLEPDPSKDSVASDFTTYGLFGFAQKKMYGINGGYTTSLYKGKEDKSYLYARGNMRPSRQLSLYGATRGDHKVKGGGYELTNLTASINYSFGRIARVGFAYSQFRAIKLYESVSYSINNEKQTTYRINGSIRPFRRTMLHGSYDNRVRESDNKSASSYLIGVRQSGILRVGHVGISYRGFKYFTSDGNQIRGDAGASLPMNLSFDVHTTLMTTEADGANQKLKQLIYGATLGWYGSRKYFVTANYEVSSEKYLDVDSAFTSGSAPATEFKSSSLFLSAGYRF